MGNCMETCAERPLQEEEITETGEFLKGKSSSMRVKIVLTKQELEWLLFQLQIRGGNYNGGLQDFLADLEMRSSSGCCRGRVDFRWKPSLESITECPEIMMMDK